MDAAEAGMPRVLFAAVELMLTPFGTDNELVLASRSVFPPTLHCLIQLVRDGLVVLYRIFLLE